MPYLVLNISNSTTLQNILLQIDGRVIATCTGSPVGIIAANNPGQLIYDTVGDQYYYASAADGTVGGTTWNTLPTGSIPSASTSVRGTIFLASHADVVAGSNDTKAVTPLGAALAYAALGANSNITSLTGLTTPLSTAQGGTGLDSSGAEEGQLLIGNDAGGFNLANILAGSTKVSIVNTAGGISADVVESNLTLANIGGTLDLTSQVANNLGIGHGGTGQSTLPTNGQLLIGDSSTSGFNLVELTATSNKITIANGNGTIGLDVNQANLSIATSQLTGVLSNAKGGTGLDTSAAANGQLLIGNGTGLSLHNLTSDSGTISYNNEVGNLSVDVNQPGLNLSSLGGLLNLTTQTSNVLGISNGGTGSSNRQDALNALAPQSASSDQVISFNGSNWVARTLSGTGTVTSVGVTGDNVLFATSISGAPITGSGTINLASSLKTQTANRVLAGPTSGGAATPTFRALVTDDLPPVDLATDAINILPVANGGTGAATIQAHKFFGNNTASSNANPSFVNITTGDLPDQVVTNSGNLSPLFNTTISNQLLSFSLNSVLSKGVYSNPAGSLGVPSFNALTLTAGTGLTGGGNVADSPTVSLAVPVTVPHGGTGQTSTPTDGQLLIGNTSTNLFNLATLTEGTGIDIDNAGGSITINNTGVTSVALSGDGTVFNTSVSGSPVTTTGTFTPTLANQDPNKILAGPTSGSPTTPTFRALTLADMPAGLGVPVVAIENANFNADPGNIYLIDLSSTDVTLTLPDATSSTGQHIIAIVILQGGTHNLTIASTSSQTINAHAASAFNQAIPLVGFTYRFVSDGFDWRTEVPTVNLNNGNATVGANVVGTLKISNGGTGASTAPSSGKLLIGNSSNGYTVGNLTSSDNTIVVTNNSGNIDISAGGIASGSENQILSYDNLGHPVAKYGFMNSKHQTFSSGGGTVNLTGVEPSLIWSEGNTGNHLAIFNLPRINNGSRSLNGKVYVFVCNPYTNIVPASQDQLIDNTAGTGITTYGSPSSVIAVEAVDINGTGTNFWKPLNLETLAYHPNTLSASQSNPQIMLLNKGVLNWSNIPTAANQLGFGDTGLDSGDINALTTSGILSVNVNYNPIAITADAPIALKVNWANNVPQYGLMHVDGNNPVTIEGVGAHVNLADGNASNYIHGLPKRHIPLGQSMLLAEGHDSTNSLQYFILGGNFTTAQGLPTAAPNGNAGSGGTASVSTNANDSSGILTLVTGTGPTSGDQVSLTQAEFVGNGPQSVQLTPANAAAAALVGTNNFYVQMTTGTDVHAATINNGFKVTFPSALAASTTYKWHYTCHE